MFCMEEESNVPLGGDFGVHLFQAAGHADGDY